MIIPISIVSTEYLLLLRRVKFFISLASLWCLAAVSTSAQDTVIESTTDTIQRDHLLAKETMSSRYPYKHYITYAPSALLNITPGVQFGYERIINNQWAVLGELGGLNSLQDDRRGFRLKAEIRDYFESAPVLYIGGEVVHKYTSTDIRDWVDAGTFLRLIDYRGTRNLTYASLKFGCSPPLGKGRRLLLDIGLSIGGGKYRVDTKGVPEGFEVREVIDGFFWDNSFRRRSLYVPMAALSIKLKYGLQ